MHGDATVTSFVGAVVIGLFDGGDDDVVSGDGGDGGI